MILTQSLLKNNLDNTNTQYQKSIKEKENIEKEKENRKIILEKSKVELREKEVELEKFKRKRKQNNTINEFCIYKTTRIRTLI